MGNEYEFRRGSMNELLDGQGAPCDGICDLINSSRGKLFIEPEFVGVFQCDIFPADMDGEIEGLKEQLGHIVNVFSSHGFNSIFRQEDGVAPNLLCVVYDPDSWREDIVRLSMGNRDVARRLKIVDYKNLPNFGEKYIYEWEDFNHFAGVGKSALAAHIGVASPSGLSRKLADDFSSTYRNERARYGLNRVESVFLEFFQRVQRDFANSE